jgi:hypothetical protein
MNFRSTHNGDGEGRSLAGDVLPFPSPARRAGQTDESSFPRSSAAALAAEGSEGAGVSSASVPSLFIPLGMAAHAVVMKLQGGFPRIRVERATEGDFAARSDDRSAAWEEEDQR